MHDLSFTPETATEKQKCQCLKKVNNLITGSLEKGFFRIGRAVGGSPWITIFISLTICGASLVGLIKFTRESRGDKLWVPKEAKSQEHLRWVEKNFPTEMHVSSVLLMAKDVLTPAILKDELMIHNKVKELGIGTEKAWEKVCFRFGPACFTTGLLELWSFDEAKINELTKEDILRKINQPTIISPVTNRKFVLSQFLGGVERNETDHIVKAEATSMSYGIKYTPVWNKGLGHMEDTLTDSWEKDFNKLMDSLDLPSLELFYITFVKFDSDAANNVQGDITLLSVGYSLIITYVAITLGKFTRLNIKAWLALLGVVCVGLAIGVSFGLASAFGVFYGPVHTTLPFLLLGIGVDDMFVIVQSWNNLSPDVRKTRGIPESMGLALQYAGCSITITSLTDFLAFMIGSTTILPGLRSFCIYAAIGILTDFALQATLFTAFLTIDARRQEKKRDGCFCCIKLKEDYKESSCGKKDFLHVVMDKFLGRAILSLPGKIVVILITATLFGINLYGTLNLRQHWEFIKFYSPDSMAYKYTKMNSKYFPEHGAPGNVYTGKFDYFENQGKLHQLYDAVSCDDYVIASSVSSWYKDYIRWATKHKPEHHFNQACNPWTVNNKTYFYLWLGEFLQGPGISYRKDIRIKKGTSPLPEIKASRISFRHKDMHAVTRTEVKAMEDLRKKIREVFNDENLAFPYSKYYLAWETNKVISEELFRNMGFALLAVFIVTLIILANLWACLLVFTCVGFTLVSIAGTMHFWGLYIDVATTIILVLAVGLSVDYASHIAHTFMVVSGTRDDRARATLRNVGRAVWNGGFSTFLAVLLLAFSNSYIFKAFFKVFFCVVLYGLFHALFYLPMLLSAIGPAPYESAQPQEHKDGWLAPVHPVELVEVTPVHTDELPGDNVSYELAVSNGMTKKMPLKNGKLPTTDKTWYGGFFVPQPDYYGVDETNLASISRVNEGFHSTSVYTDLDKA